MYKYFICGGFILLLCQLNSSASVIDKSLYMSAMVSEFLPETDSTQYKNISPRILESSTNSNGIKIIVPDEPGWKNLGKKLQNAVRGKSELGTPDPEKFMNGWSGNTILLGHLGNNKQMARLYGLRMSYADAIYPGKGGYQLLTLVDPFGSGGNTISVGASDIEGANLAVDRLVAILNEQKFPLIPWLLEVNLPKETKAYFKTSSISSEEDFRLLSIKADALLGDLKPVKDNEVIADALLAVISGIKLYGEYYQLTAMPSYGEVYRKLLLGYAHFVNSHPSEALNQLGARKNMWIQGEKIFQNWSVLEASPLFSEEERIRILAALYLTCKANALDNYLVRASAAGPRWNHEIFPAISLVGSCNYFEKYYAMPEVQVWKNLGDRIFTGNTSYISMDEGSDYLAHNPMIYIDYAMATGNSKYINQSLRPSADLHSMMIDNLGTLSGGGDTYPFGMSSAYSWGHSQLLNSASWYYHDPIYSFLLERTRTGPFPAQKMPDLSYPIHRYIAASNNPEQFINMTYPKIQAQQIEPGVYNDLKNQAKGKMGVEQHDTFHKLTFRPGFGLEDNYLILDGFSAGKHGHQDGNTILNYSSKGRLFLTDRDYIQNTPENHSGLVIVKDGEQHKKPSLAKLEWVSDLDGTSISRSSVPDYNGTNWDRTIISPEGKFFIIYDDLQFNEAGNFLLKNLWQSLGTSKIEQNTFHVDQKGVSMKLRSHTNADLRLKDIYGHFIKYWKTVYPYPYADHETVLTEIIPEKGYAIGDKAEFINILSSHGKETDAVQSISLGERLIKIRDGENNWLAIKGMININSFSSNGTFHLIGNTELVIAAVTDIKLGSKGLNFPEPVFFKLNTISGQWKTYGLLKNKVKYNKSGEPVQESAIDSGMLQWNKSIPQQLQKMLSRSDYETSSRDKQSLKPVSVKGWKKLYSLNEELSSSARGDLNGDKEDELIMGSTGGTVNAIDSDGNLLWTFPAKGRVNEVSMQLAGNRNLIFIATEKWYVHVLDTKGKELWNYKFPDDAAHREYKGNLIGITNVRLAYKNGKDKEPRIMVGTQFRYLYELDLQGKLIDETALYFYGIEDMEYADLDGDGAEEGIFALEYYYYTLIKNKELITGKTGGPGWKIAHVLNKNEKNSLPSVLLGTKQNEVRQIRYKDKLEETWTRNVGGEVNDIRHGDFNNDGYNEILVGTEGFQFYVLDEDGKVIFKRTLNDRVLKADGYRDQGKTYYLAATAEGRLHKFSEKGVMEQSVHFPSGIADILILNGNSDPWIVLKNGDLYRME